MKPDTAKRKEYYLRWLAAHPEQKAKKAEYTRKWRKANPEKVRAQNRRRLQKKREWAAANPDKTKRAEHKWRNNNKDKRNAITAARYARKLGLTPKLSAEEKRRVTQFYHTARVMTELMGEPYHVDHIKPLIKRGLHHPDNMQVLRGRDNQSKGSKWHPN